MRPSLSSNNTIAAITSGARQTAALAGKVSSGAIVNAAGALTALQNMATAPFGYGNNGGNGNNGGGNGGNNNGGNGDQGHPPLPPWTPVRGSGGHGPDGSFDVTPPSRTTGAPARGLPNLDTVRKLQPTSPKVQTPIHADELLPECDLTCGGAIPSGGAGGSDPYLATARSLPKNETGTKDAGSDGVNLGSQNVNWGVSLIDLKGRAGLDLNLTLFYNSLVWTRQDSTIEYNADQGFPGPGFQLGFPTLQPRYYNSQSGRWAYMMITPSGGRVEMQQVDANAYESLDGAYTQLTDQGSYLLVRTTDNLQYLFYPSVNNGYRCGYIQDRNGNFITISYNELGRPVTVTDTLGRVLNFIYDTNHYLVSITRTWNGATLEFVAFGYSALQMQPGFTGLNVVGPQNGATIPVLTQVSVFDGSFYTFSYTAYGQVNRITHYAQDGHQRRYTSYNMNTAAGQTECPRFSEQRVWAESWNNGAEAVTSYQVDPSGNNRWTQVTYPDGTRHKEYRANSGWQTGLTVRTEEYDGGNTMQKWTTIAWTQDDLNASYQINPRPTDTDIYDASGNHKRTHIDYTSYSLPSDVYEYAADGTTVLRRSHTDYRWDQPYLARRIIGLPSIKYVYEGGGALASKLEYHYDWGGAYLISQGAAVHHEETVYGPSFINGRGNLTGIRRWNALAPDGAGQAVWLALRRYTETGAVYMTEDGAGHQTTISYADNFSDGNNSRSTLAYPTSVTDADGNTSSARYNYDLGYVTMAQGPPAAEQSQGAVQLTEYDGSGRVQRVTTQNNGAYTRFVYGASGNYVQQWTTVQEGENAAYSIVIANGLDQPYARASDLPGSAGGYSGQVSTYDAMGRVVQQTNPTEMTVGWVPSGDDAQASWVWTNQSYDWKGRPRITTNADGSTTEAEYGELRLCGRRSHDHQRRARQT
ncbi:MAG: hypothetical protein ABR577_02070 [Pyrinomonadaceae bacterium]